MAWEEKNGRPSTYDSVFIQKVDEYLTEHQDVEVEREGKNGTYTSYIRANLPTIEGFARYIKVNKSTLYDWAGKNQDFADALEEIKQEQHERLVNAGLSNEYNPTIAKLMLSSNHGYKEKSDVTTDDKPIEGVVVLPAKE